MGTLGRDSGMVTVAEKPSALTRGVNHLAVHEGILAAGCDDGNVAIWLNGKPEAVVPVGNQSLVNAVSVASGANHLLAYGTFSGRVGIADWSAPGPDVAGVQVDQPVNRVSWCPLGKRLAVADYAGLLRIYSLEDGALRQLAVYAGHSGAVKDFCWVDDARLVSVSTDRTAHLISSDARQIRVFSGHGELVNSVSVTRVEDRGIVATASRDRTIRLYDLDTGELLNVLVGHDESVKSIAWAPDGAARLLSGGYDFTGRIWTLDPRTWRIESTEVLAAHTNAVSSVAWLDGDPVTGGWDGRVIRWRTKSRTQRLIPHELGRLPRELAK